MPSLFEAYVTNLGKYNEGELVGETLKFPATTEEVQALLKRIGVDGIRYEEIFITSFDGDVLGLYVAEDSLDIQELQYEKCKRTRCCSLFPVYHGSAKDNLGTEKLIEAIIETFITETDDIQSELCGYVFKVASVDKGIHNKTTKYGLPTY